MFFNNNRKKVFFSFFLIFFLTFEHNFQKVFSVPFVTKRVSFHNPINIDFSGWIPLRTEPEIAKQQPPDIMSAAGSEPRPEMVASLDNHFLTVPVAVETDAEHQLSTMDLNQISRTVLENWNQKNSEKNAFFMDKPEIVSKLMPKPEVELKQEQVLNTSEDQNEYTFVKMDKNQTGSEAENLFHAYFAPRDHVPPDGYIKLTKTEFKSLFKNAEILFV